MAPLRLAFITASMMTQPQSGIETRSSKNVYDNDVTMSAAAATATAAIKPMDCSSSDKENDAHKEAASLSLPTASMSSSTAASTSVLTNVPQNGEKGLIHFCFIVHGHKANRLIYPISIIQSKTRQISMEGLRLPSQVRCAM